MSAPACLNLLTKSSSINDLCLFVFGNRTKSNISFTVIDLDRLVIKHSTELDNQPFGTRTIGFSLGLITEQFDWICQIKSTTRTSIAMLAGVWVRLRRNERENLSIQTK